MASTYTVAGIELITQGEQAGAWGNTTNTNWELIEEMVGGVASVALSTTSETLSVTDGASSDARHAAVVFTGSPGGTCTVTVSPNDMQKIYFIVNNSDQTVAMSQGSGANVSIAAGSKKIVYCDGAGAGAAVVDLTTNLDISGLHLGGTEVTATAAELNYVDGVTSAIQTQLDAKQASATAVTTSTSFGGDVSGTYDAIVIADDSHNHTIANVDGLQTALDAKAPLASPALTGTATAVNLTLSGDLTVNGTTTTVNSTNTVVSDALLELGNGTTGTPANDAGLVIERGDSANAFIGFDESADKFIVGTGTFTGASTGDLTITTGTLVANIEGNVTGNLTGNVTGNTSGSSGSCTGNAATATAWATGRTISLTGDVTGTSGAFDGSGNLSFATTIAANSVALGTDTTGNYVATGATSGNGISGSVSSEGGTFTVTSNATNLNTASTIVYRDASGNFSAGTITAALSGNATTSSSCSGNAATATAWATGRTLTLSGDVSGTSSTIDGTGNITLTATVADDSHNHVISNVDGLQTALDAKQPLDADLTAIAGLSSADGNFIVGSATGWVAESGATARTSLGLGSLATLSTVDASTITDNSVGAAELNVTGNGTTSQFLRSDGDGTFTWATPTDTNTTYSAGTGISLVGTTFSNSGVTSNVAGAGIDVSAATGAVTISIESDLRGDVYYIGRDTNDYYLVNTTTHDWYLDGVLDMRLENDGDLHCDGDVIAYSTTTSSDEKLKDNIRVVEDPIGKLKQLRGVEFEWKKDGKSSAGVIAQDVEKVLPQAVKTVEDLNTQEPYKTVNYDALHALLIEAVKELSAKVEELEAKVG